jgi:TP901 family phage tail tape measure protein
MTNPNPTASSGGFNMGTATGTILLNADGAFSTLDRLGANIRSTVSGMSSAFQSMGTTISNFGVGLSTMMTPFAAGMGKGIQIAGNFQDALAEIQARAGLTDEAMVQIRDTALQLGKDTAFSAQQAAEGMLMLLTAGLDTEQALAALPAVLTGAAAAGADLGTTAEQVTNIMASFQLEAAEAARIVEVMNQAAGASPAEMSEMGEALADVGGTAARFGISLEQTGAMLTVFARNGIKGSDAATQLRSILTAMTADTVDSNKAWDMVNSSLFDASGNSRDFSVVLAEVKAGLKNLNAEEQAFVVQSLAGSFGSTGFNALLASEGIDAVTAEMNEQASAADVAAARLDTWNGRVDALMGSIETFMIIAFMPFLEAMTPMVEQITEVINSLSTWIDANQAIVQPILKMIAGLIIMGPVLIGVGQGLKFVGFLVGALVSPLNLAMLAVAAFTAAWAANFGGIQEKTAKVVGFIREAFNILVYRDFVGFGSGLHEDNQIFNFFFTLHDLVASVALSIRRVLARIVNAFKAGMRGFNSFAGVLNRTGSVVKAVIASIAGFMAEFAHSLGMPPAAALNMYYRIRATLDGLWSYVQPYILAFQNAFRVFSTTFASTGDVFDSLGYAISTFFGSLGVSGQTITTVRGVFLDFLLLLSSGWDLVSTSLNSLWAWFTNTGVPAISDGIQNTLLPAFNTMVGWLQTNIPIAVSMFSAWFNGTLIPALQSVWTYIETNLLPAFGRLWSWLQEKVPLAIQTLSTWWTTTLQPAVQKFWDYLTLNIFPAMQTLWNWLSINLPIGLAIAAAVWTTVLAPAIKTVWEWMQLFLDQIGGIEFATYLLVATGLVMGLSAAMGAVTAVMGALALAFTPLGVALIAGGLLVLAYQNNWMGFKTWVDGPLATAIRTIRDGFNRWLQVLRDIDTIIQGIKNGDWNVGDVMQQFGGSFANEMGVNGKQNSMQMMQSPGDLIVGMNPLMGFLNSAVQGGSTLGGNTVTIPGLLNSLFPSRDSGGPGMAGSPYLIGKGAQPELFVPQTNGTFIPNFDQMGSTTNNGHTFNVTVNANDYEGGVRAGKGFREELSELMRSS